MPTSFTSTGWLVHHFELLHHSIHPLYKLARVITECHFHCVKIDGEPPPLLQSARVVALDELDPGLAKVFLSIDDIKKRYLCKT